jgi:hypothetical protein
MLERAAVAPVPKLTTLEEMMLDAEDIAFRTGTKVGRKPLGKAVAKKATRAPYGRSLDMTETAHELAEVMAREPGQNVHHYAGRVQRCNRTVNFLIRCLKHNGFVIIKSRGRVPTYSMGKTK